MKSSNWLSIGVLGLLAGCSESPSEPAAAPPGPPAAAMMPEVPMPGQPGAPDAAAPAVESTPPSTTDNANLVALSEANTKVEFVGLHTGDKPDPRKGTFAKLSGTATLDAGQLKSVVVEFDTSSLTTEIEKLTEHLKSPDFFDVSQHPKARFESTSIEPGEGGVVKITGNLTLLGTTKPVTIPAMVSTDGGLKVSGKFSIDRTEFGMTYGDGKVENMVELTVTVGG